MSNIRNLMNTRIKKGKKEISVQLPGYPACSLIKRKRARDSVFYIRQRAVCGDARISINLARWTEDNVPSEDELLRLQMESRANHLAISNGINPKEVDCRALTEIANLNVNLKTAYTVKDGKVVPTENTASLLGSFLSSCIRLLSVAGPSLAALLRQLGAASGAGSSPNRSSAPSSDPLAPGSEPCSTQSRGDLSQEPTLRNGAIRGPSPQEPAPETASENSAFTAPEIVLNPLTGLAAPKKETDAAGLAPARGSTPANGTDDATETLRALAALLTKAFGSSGPDGGDAGNNPAGHAMAARGASATALSASDAIPEPDSDTGAQSSLQSGVMNLGSATDAEAVEAPEELSLEVFCREYLRDKKLKEATRKFYDSIMRVHLAPHFARFARIQDITGPRIAEIVIRPLLDRELYSTAQNTRNTIVAVINHARLIHNLGAYAHLEQVKLLSQIADLKPKADYEKSYPAMVNGDIGQNVATIFRLFFERYDSLMLRGLLELSFHLCLRQNEILNIEISDISFDTHNLHIRHTKTITEKKGGFDVPLNSHTENLLRIILEAGEAIRKDRAMPGSGSANGDDAGAADMDGSAGAGAQATRSGPERKDENDDAKTQKTDGHIFINARGAVLSTNILSVYLSRIREIKGRQSAHGIRAVFRTWASRSGISHEVSECVLSHRCWNKIDAAYNRDYGNYLYNDRKELMLRWSEYLAGSLGENSLLWRRAGGNGSKGR